jgi:phenylacetate-CoA ligase
VLLYLLPAGPADASDHRVRAYLQARLRVSPHIVYVSAEEIQKMHTRESGRKAVKFVDRRVK